MSNLPEVEQPITEPVVARIKETIIKDLPRMDLKLLALPEWHGYKVEEKGSVCVGYLPGRKKPCLYEVVNGKINMLATFSNEATAVKGLAWLDFVAQIFVRTDYGKV